MSPNIREHKSQITKMVNWKETKVAKRTDGLFYVLWTDFVRNNRVHLLVYMHSSLLLC